MNTMNTRQLLHTLKRLHLTVVRWTVVHDDDTTIVHVAHGYRTPTTPVPTPITDQAIMDTLLAISQRFAWFDRDTTGQYQLDVAHPTVQRIAWTTLLDIDEGCVEYKAMAVDERIALLLAAADAPVFVVAKPNVAVDLLEGGAWGVTYAQAWTLLALPAADAVWYEQRLRSDRALLLHDRFSTYADARTAARHHDDMVADIAA